MLFHTHLRDCQQAEVSVLWNGGGEIKVISKESVTLKMWLTHQMSAIKFHCSYKLWNTLLNFFLPGTSCIILSLDSLDAFLSSLQIWSESFN